MYNEILVLLVCVGILAINIIPDLRQSYVAAIGWALIGGILLALGAVWGLMGPTAVGEIYRSLCRLRRGPAIAREPAAAVRRRTQHRRKNEKMVAVEDWPQATAQRVGRSSRARGRSQSQSKNAKGRGKETERRNGCD